MARYGQAGLYDEIASGSTTERRMIVFGGTTALNQTPTDARVWELRFNHVTKDTATWAELPLVAGSDPAPAPRFWHRMSLDPHDRTDAATGKGGHAALMYGGALGASAYSDELWVLWLYADRTARWEHKSVAGSLVPGGRARHSLTYDFGHGHGTAEQSGARLFVFGGETATGAADRYTYSVDPWDANPTWTRWTAADSALSGHTVLQTFGGDQARVPDLYDPRDGTWRTLASAPLGQQFYPPTFLVPGAGQGASRVVSFAYDSTCWLDVPASGSPGRWRMWPSGALLSNGYRLTPQTGVCYRPGQLMVSGGLAENVGLVGTTLTLDAADTNNTWVAAGTMAPRSDCNLVLLPTGQVLAVGGVNTTDETAESVTANAMRRPQLWTPAAAGGGAWTDTTALAAQPTIREDHSTAILLPDGRVLSAGDEHVDDRRLANIYCPPYLFKNGGSTLAARPVILDAPPCIGWGQGFTVAVADTAGIRTACLIRPGATTHGYDQNQRFVPLNFSAYGNPPRLEVTAPASPDSAPPGFYLLFVLGSGDGAEVPSIAHWIRIVDNGMSSGPDQGPPAPLSDFAVDAVSQNSVYLTWTATADDGDDPDSGPACEFDLRKASSAINTEAKWDVAIPLCGEPVPGPVGTAHDYLVSGLSACSWYDFALRAKDEELNLSGLHDRVFARTLGCGGGGGGGYAARSVQGDAAFRATSGALIAASDRTAEGGWQLTLGAVGSTEGLEGAAADGVSIQERNASGAWRTLSRFRPGESEDALGLCALRERGRAIVAGDFGPQRVAGAFTADGTTYALASAAHSGLDSVDVATLAAGGAVSLAVGDTLTLRYAPTSAPDSTAAGWYLLAGRGLLITATRQRRAAAGAALPVRFALHPNVPNPFTATTTIRFDLPVGAIVRLDVFDVAGRRVSVLANHYFPPGYHALEWNRRTPSGLAAGAGVYFYRLEAGPWRDRKKMVLLP
jgi:hypothetical protein